jgi:hypothetical protein
MSRSRPLLAVVVLVVLALPFAARGFQSSRRTTLVLAGHVTLSTSADGRITLVTVDLDTPAVPADGAIDQAFRIQHLRVASTESAGQGYVVFQDGGLRVSTSDVKVAFAPLRKSEAGVTSGETSEVHAVAGITRFWGPAVRIPHVDLAARLLRPDCSVSLARMEGVGSCESCAGGGAGVPACIIDCGDALCEPTCGEGYYACCNCSGFCGCCTDQIQ